MIGLSTFGALFAWLMTLWTHLVFRRFHHRQGRPYLQLGPPGPWASLMGLGGVFAVLVSTWWVPGFRISLRAGVPWVAFVSSCVEFRVTCNKFVMLALEFPAIQYFYHEQRRLGARVEFVFTAEAISNVLDAILAASCAPKLVVLTSQVIFLGTRIAVPRAII